MAAAMARAALFLLVGLGFLALWVRQQSGWREPLPSDDPVIVFPFSALLAALGTSLLLWARHQRVAGVARVPAGGAFVSSAANLLEDGLGFEWAFFLFVASTLTLLVGQVVLAARCGRKGVVPALSALALVLYPVAGGPLMAAAWATAAWQARRRE